ncbi:AI-2E family transporter [Kitasatospora sp. NPDC059571]|uniref:AI-2E family transporter n=1 Tax=Kitasatospora sp. NPDC059571 TaxID=3346871 RepID=UPI00368337E4
MADPRRRPRPGPRSAPVRRPGPPRPADRPVHPVLRTAADHAWRLLVLGLAGYAVFTVLQRFQLVAVAVFLGLVITSVLRPVIDRLARRMPRWLAVLIGMLGTVLLLAGLLSLVGTLVADEAGRLGREFGGGLDRIERWLQGPPFRLHGTSIRDLRSKLTSYLSAHRSTLISTAVSGAGRIVEFAGGAALAVFCSVFFLNSGDRMWRWFEDQLPFGSRQVWHSAGRAAWRTFAGYTRGVVIVAASNAVLVGIALFLLRVPLALPLVLLEFLASFVPLIGSPVALAVAAVVALASRGPVVAIVLIALIVVIGQIEGHLLHPLVMSWAVQLHPVVVAIAVLCGSIAAGVIGAVVAVPLVAVVWAVIGAVRRLDRPGPGPP